MNDRLNEIQTALDLLLRRSTRLAEQLRQTNAEARALRTEARELRLAAKEAAKSLRWRQEHDREMLVREQVLNDFGVTDIGRLTRKELSEVIREVKRRIG